MQLRNSSDPDKYLIPPFSVSCIVNTCCGALTVNVQIAHPDQNNSAILGWFSEAWDFKFSILCFVAMSIIGFVVHRVIIQYPDDYGCII